MAMSGTTAAAANGDRALASALEDAWNRGDGTAWGEQFWPDARFVNAIGAALDGRDAIAALHSRIFTTVYKGSRNTFEIERLTALGNDRMLVELDGKAEGLSKLPASYPVWPDGSVHAHLMFVSEQRDSEWRIIYAQNTVVTPPPA